MPAMKGGTANTLTFSADTSVMLLANSRFSNGFKVISAIGAKSKWTLQDDPNGKNRNIYSPMETGVQFSLISDLSPVQVVNRLKNFGEQSIRNIEFNGSDTKQTENGTFIKPPENKK
jgi:hypothetical protein